jgi:hypothetical protein
MYKQREKKNLENGLLPISAADGPILRKDYDFTNDESDSGCERI